ncbi:26S proteasome non-ATPase regulatory subunit 4 [Tanacetum coccineum]
MAEVTMICVDNSGALTRGNRGTGLIKAQAEAIELYCSQKIQAHPENMVGFTTMGEVSVFCEPSRDLKYILHMLRRLIFSGFLNLPNCVGWAKYALQSSGLPKKRLVTFAGSDLHMIMPSLENLATFLKELNVAVDVINFGFQDPPMHPRGRKDKFLRAFVAAVNVDGNSRYLYAPDGSPYSLDKNLSSSPIMPRVGDGSTALAAAATVTLSLLEETKPHQNKAVVPDYENVDPERHFLYSKYGLLSSELLVVTDTISGLVIAFESPAIVSAEKAVEIIAKKISSSRDIRTSDPHALIIDGNSLAFPLDGDIKNTYFWILKALVTRLVKEGTMLQEANISIGKSGFEEMQLSGPCNWLKDLKSIDYVCGTFCVDHTQS